MRCSMCLTFSHFFTCHPIFSTSGILTWSMWHGPQGMQDGVMDQRTAFLLAHTTGFKKCSHKRTDLRSFETFLQKPQCKKYVFVLLANFLTLWALWLNPHMAKDYTKHCSGDMVRGIKGGKCFPYHCFPSNAYSLISLRSYTASCRQFLPVWSDKFGFGRHQVFLQQTEMKVFRCLTGSAEITPQTTGEMLRSTASLRAWPLPYF